jgi:hypothetical protein
MFDSPIARCEIIHEMVLIDETQVECACEHDCPPGRVCPLARYFAEPNTMIAADTTRVAPVLH